MDYVIADENVTIAISNFTGNASMFPYTNPGVDTVFCGGTFQHINDSGTDKIEFEVKSLRYFHTKIRANLRT